MINFYELNESEPTPSANLENGSIICCKDSSNMYMKPVNGGDPLKLVSTLIIISDKSRLELLAPMNTKMYFCFDTKKLWLYFNEWICINPDITPEGIGTLPSTTKIPSKTSDLQNDSNYVDQLALDKKLDKKVGTEADSGKYLKVDAAGNVVLRGLFGVE